MRDRFGRPLTGLRISVTNDCNLACFYCHKEGALTKIERSMTAEEMGEIVELSTEFGVRKIKLTGGEPLLREDIVKIVTAVTVPKVKEISLTTNGTLLAKIAAELADAGLTRVNISLDTLDEATYERITGKRLLGDVLKGIDAALDAGLKPVKINMVALAGLNDTEIEKMINYASERGAILQLIELMKMPARGKNFHRNYLDLGEVEQLLSGRAMTIQTRRSMHARKRYILPEGEVEVVRPMHNSEFCMHCTRLRLTHDGYLKPCLMRNDDLVDVLSCLREGSADEVRTAFKEAILRREPHFKAISQSDLAH
jgi:cyclic pyranopterin phosphate synthase